VHAEGLVAVHAEGLGLAAVYAEGLAVMGSLDEAEEVEGGTVDQGDSQGHHIPVRPDRSFLSGALHEVAATDPTR
jgi:hypothetical protein